MHAIHPVLAPINHESPDTCRILNPYQTPHIGRQRVMCFICVMFRATALRKYIATALQVLSLPKYQKQWVAEHFGHTMAIHEKFYRQSLDSVELTKITKIMYLADHCKMHLVKGMDIDSVDAFLRKIFLRTSTRQIRRYISLSGLRKIQWK